MTKKGSTCSTDGLYKNPKDCNSYIHCSNGVENEMPCPRGMHFSEHTKKCEMPSIAQCEKSEENSDDFQCEEDGRYVNLNSCSHFINCIGGVRYDEICPPQLHFNEKTQTCESPCDSHCDPSLGSNCSPVDLKGFPSVDSAGFEFSNKFSCGFKSCLMQITRSQVR
ncbi:papilin [Caerostris extrusa]|uniref:Papilin n=1 Tax=Caerostris extrusa TaxID=172846 RepID=A0AAV4N056_CAEEX|nr:papilin [Caerostris extrusa]